MRCIYLQIASRIAAASWRRDDNPRARSWRAGFRVKNYVVRLSKDERASLEEMTSKGNRPAREIVKARILLKADVSDAAS